MEFSPINPRRVFADLWRLRGQHVAARRQEDEVPSFRHGVLLSELRQAFGYDVTVPCIRGLLVVFGTPQLHGNSYLPQTTRSEDIAGRWCGHHGGFDAWIVDPDGRCRGGLELIAFSLLN